jgi:hypothetical protein
MEQISGPRTTEPSRRSGAMASFQRPLQLDPAPPGGSTLSRASISGATSCTSLPSFALRLLSLSKNPLDGASAAYRSRLSCCQKQERSGRCRQSAARRRG